MWKTNNLKVSVKLLTFQFFIRIVIIFLICSLKFWIAKPFNFLFISSAFHLILILKPLWTKKWLLFLTVESQAKVFVVFMKRFPTFPWQKLFQLFSKQTTIPYWLTWRIRHVDCHCQLGPLLTLPSSLSSLHCQLFTLHCHLSTFKSSPFLSTLSTLTQFVTNFPN